MERKIHQTPRIKGVRWFFHTTPMSMCMIFLWKWKSHHRAKLWANQLQEKEKNYIKYLKATTHFSHYTHTDITVLCLNGVLCIRTISIHSIQSLLINEIGIDFGMISIDKQKANVSNCSSNKTTLHLFVRYSALYEERLLLLFVSIVKMMINIFISHQHGLFSRVGLAETRFS